MSIQLKRVSFAYDQLPLFDNFSCSLPSSGVVCLWGPSGCGKTTLLRLLAGLEKPQSGYVDVPERIAMVFQENRLLPWMTALDNAKLGDGDDDTAREILMQLGLTEEELSAYPDQLSGGQQRRVALARALVAKSGLLLLDEPFNGLDEETWHSAVPLIAAYAQRKTVVLVTHIREQAEALNAVFVSFTAAPQSGEWQAEKL